VIDRKNAYPYTANTMRKHQRRKMTIDDFKMINFTQEQWIDLVVKLSYGSFECSKCGKKEFYKQSKRHIFVCKICGHHQSVTAGTIMEKTRVSLDKLFLLFFMVMQEGDMLPIVKIRDELEVSYPTAKLLFEKTKNDGIKYWLDKTWEIIYNNIAYGKIHIKINDEGESAHLPYFNKEDNNCIWLK
jgi:ribosomal protein L37AE/L43A